MKLSSGLPVLLTCSPSHGAHSLIILVVYAAIYEFPFPVILTLQLQYF